MVLLGVIATLPVLVARASRLAEALSHGPRRPVLQLAARNLARNPGRSAATTASLLVASMYNIPDGTPVTLTGPAGTTRLTTRVSKATDDALITPGAAHQLVGNTPTASTLWVRTSGDGSNQAPAATLRETLQGTGLYVADFQETRSGLTKEVTQTAAATASRLPPVQALTQE